MIDFALAAENDEFIQTMIRAANARARVVFSLEFVGCYFRAVFSEYARAIKFPVSLPLGAHFMRDAGAADLDQIINDTSYYGVPWGWKKKEVFKKLNYLLTQDCGQIQYLYCKL